SYIFHDPPTPPRLCHFFFFYDPATTEIYTLSLHDALPISLEILRRGEGDRVHEQVESAVECFADFAKHAHDVFVRANVALGHERSEEHTSELQSRGHLVCRLLLEKKKELCLPR